jgi:hypothetical protein
MKKLILIIICALLQSYGFAQYVKFQKKFFVDAYDNDAYDIICTKDTGYMLLGSVQAPLPLRGGAALVKLDSHGDTAWCKKYDQMGAERVVQCSVGGYVIVGSPYNITTFCDISIIRTNEVGDTLWTRVYQNPGYAYGKAISETTDGGFIVAGYRGYSWDANSPNDLFIMKINSSGDTLWSKIYGGSGDEIMNSMIPTKDGGYMMAGITNSFGAGDYDILLTKTDSSGNLLWSKSYGNIYTDNVGDIVQASDGGYLVCGLSKFSGSGVYFASLMKVDGSGSVQWIKEYGDTVDYWMCRLVQNSAKEIIIAGDRGMINSNDRDFCLIKTDSSGNLNWCKTFIGSQSWDHDMGMAICPDYGYILTGISHTATGICFYLVKTDTAGDSGCNNINAYPIESIPEFTVTSPVLPSISADGFILINPKPIIYQGCSVETLCYTNGVGETDSSEKMHMEIYPNPTSSLTTVMYNLADESTENVFCIFDIMGKKIEERKLSKDENQMVINTENYFEGVYFCTLISDGVAIDMIKLVVIK